MDSSEKKWKNLLQSGCFKRRVNKYRSIVPKANSQNEIRATVSGRRSSKIKIQKSGDELSTQSELLPSTTGQKLGQNECEPAGEQESHHSASGSKSSSKFEEYNHPSFDLSSESVNQNDILDTIAAADNAKFVEPDFETFLRNWSLEYKIPQRALKPLLQKLSEHYLQLPVDPRRLLKTPRSKPVIHAIDGGHYWHHSIGMILIAPLCVIKHNSFYLNLFNYRTLLASKLWKFDSIMYSIDQYQHRRTSFIQQRDCTSVANPF